MAKWKDTTSFPVPASSPADPVGWSAECSCEDFGFQAWKPMTVKDLVSRWARSLTELRVASDPAEDSGFEQLPFDGIDLPSDRVRLLTQEAIYKAGYVYKVVVASKTRLYTVTLSPSQDMAPWLCKHTLCAMTALFKIIHEADEVQFLMCPHNLRVDGVHAVRLTPDVVAVLMRGLPLKDLEL